MAETGTTKAAAIHDARRDEAYLLLQGRRDGRAAAGRVPFAEAVARIRAFGACALAGTGAAAARETLGAGFALSSIRQPDALWVARLAQQHARADRRAGPALSARARCQTARRQKPCLKIALFDPSADTAPLAALHAACFARCLGCGRDRAHCWPRPGAFAFS